MKLFFFPKPSALLKLPFFLFLTGVDIAVKLAPTWKALAEYQKTIWTSQLLAKVLAHSSQMFDFISGVDKIHCNLVTIESNLFNVNDMRSACTISH